MTYNLVRREYIVSNRSMLPLLQEKREKVAMVEVDGSMA
jgi:hypothetical protein